MQAPLHPLANGGLVVVGLIMAFFGYRFLKVFLGVAGFVLGALAGARLLPLLGLLSPTALLVGTIVCGVLATLLMFPLYLLGIFALGAASGLLIVHLLGFSANLLAIMLGILAGGLLAAALQRPLVILVTAVDGAALALGGLLALFHPVPVPRFVDAYPALFWAAVFVIAVGAAIYQFRDTARRSSSSARS